MISLLTQLAVRLPRCVILMSLALAFVSLAVMAKRLDFKTSRSELLNPKSDFQRHWLDYAGEFGATGDALVVVASDRPQSVRQAIDLVAVELRRRPDLFADIHDRFDQERLLRRGLFYLEDREVTAIRQRIDQLMVLLEGTVDPSEWQSLFRNSGEAQTRSLELFTAALTDTDGYESPWPFRQLEDTLRERLPDYPLMDDGRLGVISLRLVALDGEFVYGAKPIQELRRIVKRVSEAQPGVELGVTGLPVVEHDEMATSQRDMTLASILALCAVCLLFFLGFGSLRYPLAATGALLIGIAWTCGYLTLTPGHLNILSMSFGVILIGLGVDFAIHYVARFSAFREAGLEAELAVLKTAATGGRPICVGGVTTALAFFATGVTEFRGVAELGTIAGGGILLCVLSTLLVLPALLSGERSATFSRRSPLELWNSLLVPLWRHPRTTCMWGLVVTVLVAVGLPRLSYDHNLLNLQARGLDSVAWEQRLIAGTDRSIWYAVSLAGTREEMDRRRAAFLKLPTVQRVDDLSELLPASNPVQIESIRQIHARLAGLGAEPPVIAPVQLHQLPRELVILSEAINNPQSVERPDRRTRPNSEWLRQVDLVRTRVATDLWEQLQALKRISDPTPPSLRDLPQGLQTRFVGKSGRRLMRIYARGNSWETESLGQFVADVTTVDPSATGAPVQTYYASQQMKRSYLDAALYSAVAVFGVLWWDLRRLRFVTLAALPTLFGIVQLFGIMGLLEIPLNPANVIVLPLILGIGIDDGVHVMHDLRRYKRLQPATTHGIIMTSLTSMIGFGSLMLARHEGLRSLGRVVTLGITCCLVSSVVLLPCLTALLSPSPSSSGSRRRSQ